MRAMMMWLATAVLPLAVGAAGPARAQQAITLNPGEVLLEVDGVGEVRAAADKATIQAGVVAQAETARAAIEANSQAMDRVLAAIRAQRIEPSRVRTQIVSIAPRYSRPPINRTDEYVPRIAGYDARNSVAIEVKDPARLPALLDALTLAGANEINGPRLEIDDPRSLQLEARRRAVAQAQAQAEALAQASGMRLARVLRISERGGRGLFVGPPPPPPPPAPPPPGSISVSGSRVAVEPGQITVSAQVSVDFALLPR